MKRIELLLCCLVVLMLVSSAYVQAGGQEKQMEMTPEQKAMMEAWQKHSTPGEHHNHLAVLAGKWVMSSKMWMDPSAPPEESTGSCEYKSALGGRFMSQSCNATSWGQPFEGWGALGYDNTLKKHVAVWMDSMGTSIIQATGTCEQAGKVVKMSGEFPDPMTGSSKTFRYVVTFTDPNKHILEWFEPGPGGKEAKTMEITYTRQ